MQDAIIGDAVGFPEVSVVVPLFNEERFVDTLLGAIQLQDYPKDRLQVLCVDGLSTDSTRQRVIEAKKAMPYLELRDNPRRIIPAALNIGLRAARGEILVRMDAHATYAPDYIRCAVGALLRGDAEAVGGPQRVGGYDYCSSCIARAMTSPFGVPGAYFRYTRKPSYHDTTYLGAWRCETVARLGGWDETWEINEDTEFNIRLLRAGGRILIDPAIRVTYYPRNSMRALWRQFFRYGAWRVKTMAQYPEVARWSHLIGAGWLPASIGMVLLSVLMNPIVLVPMLGYVAITAGASSVACKDKPSFIGGTLLSMWTIHFAWSAGFWRGVWQFGMPWRTLARCGHHFVLSIGSHLCVKWKSNAQLFLARKTHCRDRASAPASAVPAERSSKALTFLAEGIRPSVVKRGFDILVSGMGLICSVPLWLLAALAIKLEDGGPVFYSQTRIGCGGRIFRVLKFRSMVPGAERESGPVWAVQNDGRVTRVGQFLRATALDELPQLINILRGDMSFVGPRPERPELVGRFRQEITGYDRRFLLQPGLTGLAQVYGQYDSHPRHKLRYDLLYARRQTLWLDLKLVVVSIWITLRGKWEARGRKV